MAAKMEHQTQSSEARFSADVDTLSAVRGREDRAQPLKDYCTGLLMPGERKSVGPMEAVMAPSGGVGQTSIAVACSSLCLISESSLIGVVGGKLLLLLSSPSVDLVPAGYALLFAVGAQAAA